MLSCFLQEENIVGIGEENELFVIAPVVNVIEMIQGEVHSLGFRRATVRLRCQGNRGTPDAASLN